MFADPPLVGIARKHGKTSAQILIRWELQHGLVEIPKSSSKERIRENADVFDFVLDHNDMGILYSLDRGLRVSWDPTGIP